MNINWKLMARPQPDGYDTDMIGERLVTSRYGSRVAPTPDGELIWPIFPAGRARWASSLDQYPLPTLTPMPLTDPRVSEGMALLELWDDVVYQSAHILTGVCLLTQGRPQGGHGCCCGNYRDDFGWIYVTGDDPWGLAEGIVHEMAHWKLRALGIWFEEWDNTLLDHAFTEVFESPVRKDKPRPMGAVLHGLYSYVHVAEMVRRIYEAKENPTPNDTDWLKLQLARITEGQGTLRRHAKASSEAGHDFLEGLDVWTSEVIAAGNAVLPAAVAF